MQAEKQDPFRIVIVGGGFAGVFAARRLQRLHRQLARATQREVEIELISDRNYFVFQPLLPEVAAGTINAQDAVTPLRLLLKKTRIRMGEVVDIDFNKQRVQIAQGTRRIPQYAQWDHLVIAVGQRTTLERFPGFSEHAFCMRDLAQAHELRNHVLQCLEHADVTQNPELKRSLLTFVVAGAGFSGVETAGELHEMLGRALPMYPNVSMDEINTVLVQRGQQILPELEPKLGTYAAQQMRKRGIDIRFGTSLARATAGAVFTADGERIDTHTLLCTIGNGPGTLVEQVGLPLERGRIQTDPTLNVKDLPNVWAIGDAASIPVASDKPHPEQQTTAPTTAQFAMAEARTCADNILQAERGNTLAPFRFKPRGTMASIGNYAAVAQAFNFKLSGLPAWLMWRGFYIGILPGFPTRLRVALNWFFDYFLPRSIVQVKTTHNSAVRVVHYAAGDVLFAPGQIVDGLYTVISGRLESKVPSETDTTSSDTTPHQQPRVAGHSATGEHRTSSSEHSQSSETGWFVRHLAAGDHWGERRLDAFAAQSAAAPADGDGRTLGWLTALEDSEVMILNRQDFNRLRTGIPALGNYLDAIPEDSYPPELRHTNRNANNQVSG